MKKRILWVGEFSGLNTGYSVYAKQILQRLHNTGKYELAELACFIRPDDPRIGEANWRVYGNLAKNEIEEQAYESHTLNKFGAWKFEDVCLDFLPQIILSCRDWYMDEYIERSAFRPYFKLIQLVPIDSIPVPTQWMQSYRNADAIMGYCDWSADILRKECDNVVGSAIPGVDLQVFKPVKDKAAHREQMGLDRDLLIVGTVNRNNKRKLYPDLIQSFSQLVQSSPANIKNRLRLLLHTSYPDWWDFPRLITDYNVSSKVLFTYKCVACGLAFVSHFQDARGICVACHKNAAQIPNTHIGFSDEELVRVYQCMDVYVQYANAEGVGMGQAEAAACGLPVFSIDYSGMSDVVRKLGGIPLKPLKLQYDGDSNTERAIPDNNLLVQTLAKHFQLPEDYKKKLSQKVRANTEHFFDWNNTAAKWIETIDNLDISNNRSWMSPMRKHRFAVEIPDIPNTDDFVEWCILNLVGRPELLNHYMRTRLVRDLQWQGRLQSTGDIYFNEASNLGFRPSRREFSREDCVHELISLCKLYNNWEQKRCEILKIG